MDFTVNNSGKLAILIIICIIEAVNENKITGMYNIILMALIYLQEIILTVFQELEATVQNL